VGLGNRLLLASALCLVSACTSKVEEKPLQSPLATPEASKPTPAKAAPAPAEPVPIPITEAPTFERKAGDLPAFFQGARCVVSAPTSTEEEKSFTEAFLSEFYRGGFKEVGASSNAEFFEEGQRAKPEAAPDFVVQLEYKAATVAQALEGRADVDHLIKSQATVQLQGGQSRASRSFNARLKHDQPTTQAREAAMRPAHASVTGRLLAQKLLQSLSHARGNAIRFEYSLVFKGYDRQEAREIVEIVSSLPGVGPQDLSQRASGVGLVSLILNSEQPKQALSESILEKLEDEDLAAVYGTPEPSTLFFMRN